MVLQIFLMRKKAPIEILINQLVNSFFPKFYLKEIVNDSENIKNELMKQLKIEKLK
jgi:hypothetical protein